jgi:hypothetical protein
MPGGNEDIHENPVRIGPSLGRDLKSDFTAYGLIRTAVRWDNGWRTGLSNFVSVTHSGAYQKKSWAAFVICRRCAFLWVRLPAWSSSTFLQEPPASTKNRLLGFNLLGLNTRKLVVSYFVTDPSLPSLSSSLAHVQWKLFCMWSISRRCQCLDYMPSNGMDLEGNRHGLIDVLSRNLPGRTTEENHEDHQSAWPQFGPRNNSRTVKDVLD